MALKMKTCTCVKCGKPFVKWVGGIVLTPEEKELLQKPLCDDCKTKPQTTPQ